MYKRQTQNRFGRESRFYEGVGESKKWMRIETYGPKLVENIVQATARDLLAQAMLRLRNKAVSYTHLDVYKRQAMISLL